MISSFFFLQSVEEKLEQLSVEKLVAEIEKVVLIDELQNSFR